MVTALDAGECSVGICARNSPQASLAPVNPRGYVGGRADDAAQAAADYKAEQDALRAKTARLRALRLAREAAGRPEKKSK